MPDLRAAPRLRRWCADWTPPIARASSATLDGERFTFLGETHALGINCWDDPSISLLWRYNLHYFDYLTSERPPSQPLIERWIAENGPGQGTGWAPYPTSLRIVNWIKWSRAERTLSAHAIDSLAVQTRWLAAHLETHLLGNHLFSNAKALVYSGLFFDGTEAAGWFERGATILLSQLSEQILNDGGHFERSPMYHASALEDVLDLINACRASGEAPRAANSLVAALERRVPPMLAWLRTMSHPDGGISFFNDAAFDIAPTLAQLDAYAQRLGFHHEPVIPNVHLASSGYVRLERGAAVAILDVAPVGPDYLPGHAHADTLSFELSIDGQRVIVNSGTSRYGADAERQRQRGTAAHSTVVIDDENSSEVWGGFRVGRRAYPIDVVASLGPALSVDAAHDGYARKARGAVHHRRWTLDNESLTIEDRIDGDFRRAEARFHLHPAVTVLVSGYECLVTLPTGRTIHAETSPSLPRVEPGTWHPAFGRPEPNHCLVVSFQKTNRIVTVWRWPQTVDCAE